MNTKLQTVSCPAICRILLARSCLIWTTVILAACGSGGDSDSSPGPTASNDDSFSPVVSNPPAVETSGFFADVAISKGLNYVSKTGEAFASLSEDQHLMQRNFGSGAAVGDYDNDGDLDVYLLSQVGTKNSLFRNNVSQGSSTFSAMDNTVLDDTEGLARLAHFVDLNNDGHLDILLINDDDGASQTGPSKIFQNNGDSTFSDVTAMSGFRPIGCFQGGTSIADFDLDGLLDIYVTQWCAEFGKGLPLMSGANKLYRNLGNFQFLDVSVVTNLNDLNRDSFTSIFTDFNDDHYPDLYVAVDHTSDEFFYNNAGTFTNDTISTGTTHIGNDMGVAAADIDDDGDLDLYATNITDPDGTFGTTQGNVMYINQTVETGSLTFVDQATELGAKDTYWGWGTEFVDVENDGDLDLLAVTGFDEMVRKSKDPNTEKTSSILETPSVFLRNTNGKFFRIEDEAIDLPEDSRALIAFDYDRDGDQDLLITSINRPVRLLENQSPNQGHWLHLTLAPDNKAIGATIYIDIAGDVTKRRDVIAGRSFYSGTPSEVHFGLGEVTQVEQLRIVWSDGSEQIMNNVGVDQLLEIQFDGSP